MPRRCLGHINSGEACAFSARGVPAQPKPGQQRCSWCDPTLLRGVLQKENGKNRLKQLFVKLPDYTVDVALRRLPEELRPEFRTAREKAAAPPEDREAEPPKKKERRPSKDKED